MSTLGKRIRDGRKNRGLSQAEVARAMGISVQAISQWETDKTVPTADRLLFLGDLLGLDLRSANYRGELGPYRKDTRVGRYIVPLVSRVAAGNWTEAVAPEIGDDAEVLEVYWPPSGAAFALEIGGESMLPDFKPGDIIIVDPGIEPIPGDFVVAMLEGENEATFKKFRPRGTDDASQPPSNRATNPDYPRHDFSSAPAG